MKEFAELIQAIASLLWPILTFVILLLFRSEITDLVRRLKRGKFLGQELELNESLDKLDESAIVASTQIPELAASNEKPDEEQKAPKLILGQSDITDEVQKILGAAEDSPKIGLMLLAVEIEKELRQIVFSQGRVGEYYVYTLSNAIKNLEQRELLPAHLIEALRNFREVNNQIIHGRSTVSSDDVFRAIDSGILILKTLRAVPRAIHTVHRAHVDLFSDRNCTQLRDDVHGVILETTFADTTQFSIYPTTRTHFQKDQQVAWEWNDRLSWTASWYRDPSSGEITLAWSDALEFVGRSVEDTYL